MAAKVPRARVSWPLDRYVREGWRFWKLTLFPPQEGGGLTNGTLFSTASTCTICARSLDFGSRYLQLTMTTPFNENSIAFDYGFLEIVPTPLSVHIKGGARRVVIEGDLLTFDGSETYDADVFAEPGRTGVRLVVRYNASRPEQDLDLNGLIQDMTNCENKKWNRVKNHRSMSMIRTTQLLSSPQLSLILTIWARRLFCYWHGWSLFFPGNYTGMNFTWVCAGAHEHVDLNAFASLPEIHPTDDPGAFSDCFGQSPGRFRTTNLTYSFNSSKLTRGRTYAVTLIVQKGKRLNTFTQILNIAEGPPAFLIRYGDSRHFSSVFECGVYSRAGFI